MYQYCWILIVLILIVQFRYKSNSSYPSSITISSNVRSTSGFSVKSSKSFWKNFIKSLLITCSPRRNDDEIETATGTMVLIVSLSLLSSIAFAISVELLFMFCTKRMNTK